MFWTTKTGLGLETSQTKEAMRSLSPETEKDISVPAWKLKNLHQRKKSEKKID